MTFSNGKATVSFDVRETPDGPAVFVHSLSGDAFAVRRVLEEMESEIARRGFDRWYVAKDIGTEAEQIKKIMGRFGIQPKVIIFEKVLNNGSSTSVSGDRRGHGLRGSGTCIGDRIAWPGERCPECGGQTGQDEPAPVGHRGVREP